MGFTRQAGPTRGDWIRNSEEKINNNRKIKKYFFQKKIKKIK